MPRALLSLLPLMLAWAISGAMAPARAQSADAPPLHRIRFVEAGQRQLFWFSWAVTAECEVVRGFSVEVDKPPEKGEVTLEKSPQVITIDWLTSGVSPAQRENARRCLGRTLPTLSVYYRAHPGSSGSDSLRLLLINSRGTGQRVVEFAIHIR